MAKNRGLKNARNLGITKVKHWKKKSKPKPSIDVEKIKNLLVCLEEGNLSPIRNYLKSLLPKVKKRTTFSTAKSEEFREENLKKSTPAERAAKKVLRSLKVRFVPQQVVHYDRGKFYILDIYIPNQKLAIEIDGGYHTTEEQQKKDELRTSRLNKMGIEVVRYTNEEALDPMFVDDIKFLLKL
jgi:very-short-patch-repair endonuclease